MSTGTVIITRALNRLGAFSIISPPDPASILVGMDNLNSMMETWLSRAMDLGVIPLEVPEDDLKTLTKRCNVNTSVTLSGLREARQMAEKFL